MLDVTSERIVDGKLRPETTNPYGDVKTVLDKLRFPVVDAVNAEAANILDRAMKIKIVSKILYLLWRSYEPIWHSGVVEYGRERDAWEKFVLNNLYL